MNLKFVMAIFITYSAISVASLQAKTQEESIKESLANVAGATMRQLGKQPKSDCDKQYQGQEAEACKKGFDASDQMLKKQVK